MPRPRKSHSAHELRRFLALLERTGNFALACATLGRAKSGLYKRRQRDPAFAARCRAALALSSPGRGGGPLAEEPMVEGAGNAPELILTACAGRPQLRRALPRSLTRDRLDAFLRALAATANVRLSARAIGAAHSSVYAHARRDRAFGEAMAATLELACHDLQADLLAEMLAPDPFAADDGENPSPLQGRGHLGEAERGEGEGVTRNAGACATCGERPARRIAGPITAADALQLLILHRNAFTAAPRTRREAVPPNPYCRTAVSGDALLDLVMHKLAMIGEQARTEGGGAKGARG